MYLVKKGVDVKYMFGKQTVFEILLDAKIELINLFH
jgi:hypothetical protein